MTDIARRYNNNPILKPGDLKPSVEGLEITCLLNPGAFIYQGRTWLIVRVAERPAQKDGEISFPVIQQTGELQIIRIAAGDPELKKTDARVINYKGKDYLTTLSHLRLLCSDDGVHFHEPEGYPHLTGYGPLESFGIEDCRVTQMDDVYYLTFTAVSENGVGVGMKSTTDWKNFTSYGLILPPHNKDCTLFTEKINGNCHMLHRPSSVDIGGNFIWLAQSPDGIHWGNHRCLLKTRDKSWDSKRIGAGASPIKTHRGWLEIYHGANEKHQYCLGAFLMDLEDPSKVTGRTQNPVMVPQAPYEVSGFFGNVVFTNGHILEEDGDTIRMYYGASDEFVCMATFSIREILSELNAQHV